MVIGKTQESCDREARFAALASLAFITQNKRGKLKRDNSPALHGIFFFCALFSIRSACSVSFWQCLSMQRIRLA
jgi:hypothetical protein